MSPARLPDLGFSHDQFSRGWTSIWAIASVVLRELARRKDFYVVFVLTAVLTLALGSATFFGEHQVFRYLKEICLLMIWIASIAIGVTTAARQLPQEKERRTLLPLLAKPVTRAQVVVGKFVGCWLASGLCLLVFYLFFAVISGVREHYWPWPDYFQALTLHWFMLGIITAMTLLGSVVFAAPSSNNTITFVVVAGILLLGRHLGKVAAQLAEPGRTIIETIYYLLPHLEFYDVRSLIIHDWGTIPWGAWAGALLYALVYTVFFLFAACLRFRRRPVV